MQPGAKLPAERDLARRLKTSRVSVREAYRSLEELGLITVKRGAEGGAFICDVDHAPVARFLAVMLKLGRTSREELTEARLLVEPPSARLAARRARPADIERLRDLIEKQARAFTQNRSSRRYDLQFHRLVAQCSRNLPLLLIMNSVVDLVHEEIAPIEIPAGVKRDVLRFHREIADAIERRDEDAAYQIMLSHVAVVQSRLGTSLARRRRGGAAAAKRRGASGAVPGRRTKTRAARGT
jgi:DNA-binding FadR family transcriptional regulator